MISSDSNPAIYQAACLDTSSYHVNDEYTFKSLISEIIKQHWEAQTSLLFVVKNEQLADLKRLLGGKYANFTFDWTDTSMHYKEQFKLKINQEIPHLIPDFDAIVTYEAITERKNNHYKQLLQNDAALLNSLLNLESDLEPSAQSHLLDLQFDKLKNPLLNHQAIKNKLNRLKELYPSGISKTIEQNPIKLTSVKNHEQSLLDLASCIKQLKPLAEAYILAIQSKKNEISQSIKEDYHLYQNFANELKLNYKKQSLTKEFVIPKKRMFDKLLNTQKVEKSLPEINVPTFKFKQHNTLAQELINKLNQNKLDNSVFDLDDWTDHSTKILKQTLQSYNPINLNNQEIRDLEEQINELINNINALSIVANNIEFFPINMLQKEIQLWNLCKLSDSILWWMEAQRELIAWQIDSSFDVETKQVIIELCNLEKQTAAALLDRMMNLSTALSSSDPIFYDTTNDIEHQIKNKQEYSIANEQFCWLKQLRNRNTAIEHVKQTNSKTYTELFRKKRLADNLGSTFAENYGAECGHLFSFHMITPEQSPWIDCIKPQKTVFINPTEALEINDATTIHFDQEAEENLLQNFEISPKIIDQLSIRGQLPFASKLAKTICNLCNGAFAVFTKKNNNVLSFVHQDQQKYLSAQMKERGYKVLAFNDDGSNLLTEILLNTQAKTTIILNDNLLSLEHYKHFNYQRSILKALSVNEIRMVNINTFDFLQQANICLNKAVQNATALDPQVQLNV